MSPILWWVDKAHTEPFTFSLVTITLVLCVEQPSWAFVAAGLAATQNPPFAILVVVVALVNWLVRPAIFAQRCVRLALLVGIALSLLHPLYYSIRVGRSHPCPAISCGTGRTFASSSRSSSIPILVLSSPSRF